MAISGHDLGGRAYTQAQEFRAQILIAKDAKGLACASGQTYSLFFSS